MNTAVHKLLLGERKHLEIEAVSDVISFDEFSVLLRTSCGNMEIEGTELHVSALDLASGEVRVDGKINGIFYYDEKEKGEKKGFFGRFASSR